MDNDMLRKIIMDHYKFPHNKIADDEEYKNFKRLIGTNPSCGDEVELYVLFEDEIVKDIYFKGSGCSICCASISILTDEIKGLSKSEAINKIKNFESMISGKDYDENLFEDAIAFMDLSKFPARFKCAFISWDTLFKLIGEADE